jgi:hypothetical protein
MNGRGSVEIVRAFSEETWGWETELKYNGLLYDTMHGLRDVS